MKKPYKKPNVVTTALTAVPPVSDAAPAESRSHQNGSPSAGGAFSQASALGTAVVREIIIETYAMPDGSIRRKYIYPEDKKPQPKPTGGMDGVPDDQIPF